MSRSIVLSGALACAVVASLVGSPAYAAPEFDITVSPTTAKPGESFTVTGDATDPTCAEDGVAVTLNFTRPDGTTGAQTVNTTTDAAGHFEATVTVPDNAYAGEAASVRALIADCNPPSGPSEGTRSSVRKTFTIEAYEGSFTISRKSGRPGDVVTFAGTNCWGGEAVVFFGDDAMTGEPEADKSFGGEYVLPDAPDGTYEFGAECPGTDYTVYSFRLINPAPAPPAAPPARPVRGRPTFTG